MFGIAVHRDRRVARGFAGGWKPKGVELIVDGSTIFVDQGTDRWLEDKRVSET